MNPYLLLTGVRNLLLGNGIEPIVLGPLQGPGACVGLTLIPLVDDMRTGNILCAVQVRIRGDATLGMQPVMNRQADILDILCVENTQIGGHVVVTSWRQTSAPLTLDASGRPEVFDTYYLRTDRLGRS